MPYDSEREPFGTLTEYYSPEGAWQDIATGVNPEYANPENADSSTAHPGMPSEPIYTRFDGPWGAPWWDGKEDPFAVSGLFSSANPTYPDQDYGAMPLPGAYEAAFRTHGPVLAWGHEPSGGLGGDQAVGRIMRFPSNVPERYDAEGVWNIDYMDELAQAIAHGNEPIITEAEYTTSLLLGPRY